jgi:hypothetical protein
MDCVFDRVVGGRAIRGLTVLGDAAHETIALVSEHSISGGEADRTGLAKLGHLHRIVQRAPTAWRCERALFHQLIAARVMIEA